MLNYKFLLLDADGTFLNFALTEKIALDLLFDHYNLTHDEKTFSSYEEGNRLCWREFEQGIISMDELKVKRFSLFFAKEGLHFDPSEANRLYVHYLASNGHYISGAEDVLKRLSHDYTLEVITNGIASVQRGRLDALGASKYFDHIIISEEIGCQKPSAAFFEKTLEIIHAAKNECLIIGDSLTSDIKGGIESGIDTCYLHLGKSPGTSDTRIKYHASSYSELLSIIYADQVDIENK